MLSRHLTWRRTPWSFTLLLFIVSLPAQALDKVSLQFKWTHGFQFAGYYAAIEQGYYRDAGLEVELLEAQPGEDPVQNVVDGKADYGVGNSSLLLARAAGQPVVVLAAVFQHSPQVLITLEKNATQVIHDLAGKKFMIEHQSAELLAYLKQEGLTTDRFTLLEHSFDPQDLIRGKVDAMSAYVTNEPYYLEQAGVPYQVYTPRSVGIDFYGDNLFTTENELQSHPKRVRAMREASMRGWHYAMEHPQQIIDLILSKYSRQHSRAFYQWEAQRLVPMLDTDIIEIGYMNTGRWQHIADTYADLGLLPRNYSLEGFLYDPDPKHNLAGLYVAIALLLLACTIAFYIYRVNRRLGSALTEISSAHEALRISEERHRLLADHATDVIWTMNLDGKITYVSPSVEKLRGYTSAEVMQQSIEQLLTAESAEIALEGLKKTIEAVHAGLPVPEFRGELEQPCKDGSTVWTEVTTTGITNPDGQFVAILGVTRDITERRKMEEQIRQFAFHDPLTQLPNRRLLADRLLQTIAANKRSECYGALLFLDLDNFKPLNDLHGHEAGDLLLIEAAKRLRSCVRQNDTVARFGGDEFVIMISELSTHRNESIILARHIAEKLRTELSAPYLLPVPGSPSNKKMVEHQCTTSIGLTLFLGDKVDPEELIKRADEAMYQAKQSGRNAIKMASEPPEEKGGHGLSNFIQLTWHADYESGNVLIDRQHHSLFDDANAIINAVLSEQPRDSLTPLVQTLINHVRQHFADEEKIIVDAGFPGAAAHAIRHHELMEHAGILTGQFDLGTLEVGHLLQFLAQEVVARHMLGEDRKFFPYLPEAVDHPAKRPIRHADPKAAEPS